MTETRGPNVKRLRQLADHVDGMPSYDALGDGPAIDMHMWLADCGTVGCIAGHAVVLFDGPERAQELYPNRERARKSIVERAGELLVISPSSPKRALFFPPVSDGYLGTIDGDQCAEVLRYVADNPAADLDAINAAWEEAVR